MRPGAAAPLRNVEAVLESIRRGQKNLARNPKGTIERAVKQLLAGGPVRPAPPASSAGSSSGAPQVHPTVTDQA